VLGVRRGSVLCSCIDECGVLCMIHVLQSQTVYTQALTVSWFWSGKAFLQHCCSDHLANLFPPPGHLNHLPAMAAPTYNFYDLLEDADEAGEFVPVQKKQERQAQAARKQGSAGASTSNGPRTSAASSSSMSEPRAGSGGGATRSVALHFAPCCVLRSSARCPMQPQCCVLVLFSTARWMLLCCAVGAPTQQPVVFAPAPAPPPTPDHPQTPQPTTAGRLTTTELSRKCLWIARRVMWS